MVDNRRRTDTLQDVTRDLRSMLRTAPSASFAASPCPIAEGRSLDQAKRVNPEHTQILGGLGTCSW